jgi:hypothetical protein
MMPRACAGNISQERTPGGPPLPHEDLAEDAFQRRRITDLLGPLPEGPSTLRAKPWKFIAFTRVKALRKSGFNRYRFAAARRSA